MPTERNNSIKNIIALLLVIPLALKGSQTPPKNFANIQIVFGAQKWDRPEHPFNIGSCITFQDSEKVTSRSRNGVHTLFYKGTELVILEVIVDDASQQCALSFTLKPDKNAVAHSGLAIAKYGTSVMLGSSTDGCIKYECIMPLAGNHDYLQCDPNSQLAKALKFLQLLPDTNKKPKYD